MTTGNCFALVTRGCAKCLSLDEPDVYEYGDLMTRKVKGKRTVEGKVGYDDPDLQAYLMVYSPTSAKHQQRKRVRIALRVFLFCSQEDEKLKEHLDKPLSSLKRGGEINVGLDRKLAAAMNGIA